MILGMFIRVNGKPQLCMLVSIAGCILNVVLDYMFVARMELGVKGSAIGSLLVQLVTVLAQLMFFFLPDTIVRFRRFVFDREVGKEMILNGSSEFIGEMASAISMCVFNYANDFFIRYNIALDEKMCLDENIIDLKVNNLNIKRAGWHLPSSIFYMKYIFYQHIKVL